MIFAYPGKYKTCGLFIPGHFILIIASIIGIIISLKKTVNKSKKQIKEIIKKCTILIWIFEIIVISFKIATGGIAGGLLFIIFPTTSLMTYPMMHFVSLHSFWFHGTMLYLGLLVNVTDYITINLKDIKYYASLVGIICLVAFILNNIFDSNLMFISKNFEAISIIDFLYKTTGQFYTLVVSVLQMILPFYTIYGLLKLTKGTESQM